MSTPFSRTTRSLDADSFRRSTLALVVAAIVIGSWIGWLCLSSITLYELTDSARLQVDSAVHPIESPVAGRVIRVVLVVGKEVKAGDILVELDSQAERLKLNEETARLAALTGQIGALRDRRAAEQQAKAEIQLGNPAAIDESRARFEEADAVARSAAEEARRLERLHANGLVSEMDLLRARSEAEKRRAAASALGFGAERLNKDQRAITSDRQAQIEAINQSVASLEGDMNTIRATIERLTHEIDRRYIRASADGRLGEAAELRAGSVVREGDRLGAIIPAGTLRVVAEFAPSSALGRVRAGQRARVRLAGFPWTEYGTLTATVGSVAGEPRDSKVRVELMLDKDSSPAIPLQHGLPGSVEVEVDRVSPAMLILRQVGKHLSSLKGSGK
jgi:membrane fusion protein (multidrug efflux system)